MAGFRKSFRLSSEKWSGEKKKSTITIVIPRSSAGFGFTVIWTKPPQVDFIHEDGTAAKAGLLPGDKLISIGKVPLAKKSREEVENLVKNVKDIMELEIFRSEGEFATRKRQTSLRRKDSFTKKGPKMVIQDCNIMLWRRERALLKVLLCEEDLLNIIILGKERFIFPLRKRCTLATEAELNILFGNIEEVEAVYERHIQLFRQLTQSNEDNVGRLYQKQIDERFYVLRKYISGLPLAKLLLKYKYINSRFKEFIEDAQSSIERIEILQFLEKPLKYISDLIATLAVLLSCTAVGHRDYVCLENIISVFRTFEGEMNGVMKELSTIEDLRNIENAFDDEEPYINLKVLQEKTLFTKGPRDFSLVHPGRNWLFAGSLSKIEGKHYIEYWAILLSDCLILARRTEQRVLIVLEEPVFLRSIYQATFDVKKCDSEFRILFAVENAHKSVGQRNHWITWILRAPSIGIKLLWQAIITNQLSRHSTDALSYGKNPSFVHVKPPLGLRSLLPKTNLKHSESSFCNTQSQLSMFASYMNKNQFYSTEIFKNTIRGNPSVKSRFGEKEISFKLEKESSQISLDDGKPEEKVLAVRRASLSRSKSFGNDIKDAIPYIDCFEESNSGTESNLDSIQTNTPVNKVKPPIGVADSRVFESNTSLQVISGTPERVDRFVQTEIGFFSNSPRSPKKFPRLGTFERIKLENKSATLPMKNPPKFCRTRTGTSSKHRRPMTTTVSREPLIKSETLSPIMDRKCSEPRSITPILQKRSRKGFFSRWWKKESKPYSELGIRNFERGDKGDIGDKTKATLSLNDYSDSCTGMKNFESEEKLNFELLVREPNSSQVSF